MPPTETLAMFLAQAPGTDRSSQQAVNSFLARRVAGDLSACSISTTLSAAHGNAPRAHGAFAAAVYAPHGLADATTSNNR